VLKALGISDGQGRVKPSRQAKYRQVEEFLRALAVAIEDATRTGRLREPTPKDPLRVVDLGCGNAYLTFAAHAWLSEQMPVRRSPTKTTPAAISRRASPRVSPGATRAIARSNRSPPTSSGTMKSKRDERAEGGRAGMGRRPRPCGSSRRSTS